MKQDHQLESKGSLDINFNAEQYAKKLATLVSFAPKNEYQTTKEIKKEDGWHARISEVRNQLGKHFKFLFVREKHEDGSSFVRPLIVQEFDQYDSHACNKIVGQVILPVKKVEGKYMAAITVYAPPGAYGKVMFGAIRSSNSQAPKSIFMSCPDFIYRKMQRQDFARLTGQVATKMVFVDEEMEKTIDDKKEKIVWMELAELAELLNDERLQDSMSICLIQAFMMAANGLEK